MSVALYIVTKKKIKGFDPFVNGKAVGRVEDQAMEALCDALKVKSLMSFISQNPDELAEFLEDEGIDDEGGGEFPKEEWFSPEEGLVTVRALIAHLVQNSSALPESGAVVDDLKEFEQVLAALAEKR